MSETPKPKPYLLDNEPVTGSELIERAQRLGYRSEDGLYRTSEAAAVLREAGHEVTTNQAYAGDPGA